MTRTGTLLEGERALAILHNGVFEMRVRGAAGRSKRIDAGYFIDPHKAIEAAAALDRMEPRGIYVTLNPVPAAMHARIKDRLEPFAEGLTTDANVTERRALLLDLDPKNEGNIAGVCATDAEKAVVMERAESIREGLMGLGMPEPLMIDSGNGAYAIFPVSLPNDEESAKLVQGVLAAVNQEWGGNGVSVDQSVWNAARILRVPGFVNRKGDSTPDRPHRPCRLIYVPDYLADGWAEPAPRATLEAVAALYVAPMPKQAGRANGHASGHSTEYEHRLKVGEWLRDRGVQFELKDKQSDGRDIFIIDCPFDASHKGEANINQNGSGKLGAKCFHNGCSAQHWHQFKEAIGKPDGHHWDPPFEKTASQSKSTTPKGGIEPEDKPRPPRIIPQFRNMAELVGTFPTLRTPVIEPLLRRGETMNVISATKIGKSWLATDLALAVRTGRMWLARHAVTAGEVLIIDNELHPETTAHRIPAVALARGIHAGEYAEGLCVENLRGRLIDIFAMEDYFEQLERDRWRLIIIDAWYRMMPEGESENDNALIMRCFNALDHYADMTGSSIAVVHHSSKGSQSSKRATDVGSGAGSMSRAADTHLILREHEEANCAVLDAALRSWKPIEPAVLRWTFPVWNIDDNLDPEALKGLKTKGEEQQEKRDTVGIRTIVDALREYPDQTRTKLAASAGMGIERLNRILASMKREGSLKVQPTRIRGNETEVIRLSDDDRPARFQTYSGAPEDVPEEAIT